MFGRQLSLHAQKRVTAELLRERRATAIGSPPVSDMYRDLKAMAGEHGLIPAFKLTPDAPRGQLVTAFLALYTEGDQPEFARLVVYDSPDRTATQQFIIEAERLRALVAELQQPPQ